MKIDLHTHILPQHWPDLRERYGYGGFVRLEHHAPCRARMFIDDQFFRAALDQLEGLCNRGLVVLPHWRYLLD